MAKIQIPKSALEFQWDQHGTHIFIISRNNGNVCVNHVTCFSWFIIYIFKISRYRSQHVFSLFFQFISFLFSLFCLYSLFVLLQLQVFSAFACALRTLHVWMYLFACLLACLVWVVCVILCMCESAFLWIRRDEFVLFWFFELSYSS